MSIEELADGYYEQAIKSEEDGDFAAALIFLESSLSIEPRHMLSLIASGDIYTLYADELGMDQKMACKKALSFFNRALRIEPENAEAWAGKSQALLYSGKHEKALAAAERGLNVLPLRIGFGLTYPDFYRIIAEALWDRKISALLELGRTQEARYAMSDALREYPESKYLNRHTTDFCEALGVPVGEVEGDDSSDS